MNPGNIKIKNVSSFVVYRIVCRVMFLTLVGGLNPYRHYMHVGGCRNMPFCGVIYSVSTCLVSLYLIVNEGDIGVHSESQTSSHLQMDTPFKYLIQLPIKTIHACQVLNPRNVP